MSASDETMNCEEYRKAIAADPRALSDDAARHVAECEACTAYMADMQALDARIARALEIPVPELKMPELLPIDGDKVTSLPAAKKRIISPPTWIAIAASFALAAIIGIQLYGVNPAAGTSLAEDILVHLDHEPGALTVTDVAVSDERLNQVVSPSASQFDRNVGLITYAQSCIIRGNSVPHLVMQGKKGPITLLLMPDEKVDNAMPIAGESVNGVILPMGHGSIAIVGQRDEALDEVEQRIIDSVEWKL
jgi:hypothetical protein